MNQCSQQTDIYNDGRTPDEEIAERGPQVERSKAGLNRQQPAIKNIQLILPIHNEAANIAKLAKAILEALQKSSYSIKILIVNDGSTDGSNEVIAELSQKHSEISFISFSRNFGKEAALMAGVNECGNDFDLLAYMDSDGQHTPDDLLKLIVEAENSNVDLVCGARTDRDYQTPAQRFATSCFYKIFHLMSKEEIHEGVGDFNVFRPKVVFALRRLNEDHLFMKGLVSWVGFKKKIVPITVQPRANGTPKSSTLKMLKLALGAILSFSAWPLRAWSIVGISSSLVALAYLTFIVVKTAVYGTDVPGYASTIVLLLGLGGLQIFSIGILGEYIGRIYDSSKRRPRYIIAEKSDD
ncbi:MAG: glycosyltransferase family 2 protein [Marinobacter sp.]|uniref:glycosyltransferase family 2 protein n=1 Tax=Marinobacter sp. TaxID=50741 RepID=UPI0032994F96